MTRHLPAVVVAVLLAAGFAHAVSLPDVPDRPRDTCTYYEDGSARCSDGTVKHVDH